MKNKKIIIAIILGFSLSYIPNNFMSEKYENFAFMIVLGIAIIGVLRAFLATKKKSSTDS